MTVRELRDIDGTALQAFVEALTDEDRTFLKGERMASAGIANVADRESAVKVVSISNNGDIEGYATIHPGVGMSAHVGEIRLIVAKWARGRGVGLALARRIMVEGFSTSGFSKLSVEVVAEEQATIRMFSKLGFAPEALLRDHLRDAEGNLRDLVVLCHLAEDGLSELGTLGMLNSG